MVESNESPSGKALYETDTYANELACYEWLVDEASKAARWLGYVPFDWIKDGRNKDAIDAQLYDGASPAPKLSVIPELYLPEDLDPTIELEHWNPPQRHHLVFWGEKQGLDAVLEPLAETYKALPLPAERGEHRLDAHHDGSERGDGRSGDGGARVRRRGPERLSDGDLDRPQAQGLQGLRGPKAGLQGRGARAHGRAGEAARPAA
jgi:hypothetical protein